MGFYLILWVLTIQIDLIEIYWCRSRSRFHPWRADYVKLHARDLDWATTIKSVGLNVKWKGNTSHLPNDKGPYELWTMLKTKRTTCAHKDKINVLVVLMVNE